VPRSKTCTVISTALPEPFADLLHPAKTASKTAAKINPRLFIIITPLSEVFAIQQAASIRPLLSG